MIVSPELEQETFKSSLLHQLEQLDKGDPLYKVRLKAAERVKEIGFPTKKSEVYRYIKLRHLYTRNYTLGCAASVEAHWIDPLVLPESTHSILVFVNGHFRRDLSRLEAIPSKVVISSLEEAAQTYGTLLNNHLNQSLKDEEDAFSAVNTALHRHGAFVYIPPRSVLEKPIQILHFVNAGEGLHFLLPRINIFVGAQAEASFAATCYNHGEQEYLSHQLFDFVIEEGAHVQLGQDLTGMPSSAWHFEAVKAYLKKNSSFKSTCITTGCATVRTDYKITLAGENCETSLNGAWILEDKNESHVNVIVDHQAPHCRSNQLFKGVLHDFSRSSFEGKIMVRQAAQKTEAFQLNNNLVLSDHAHANSKPNLEIFADDVKATHGATIGQLDSEQLFYMKTRGFSIAEAQKLLIHGFYEEVIERLPLKSMREKRLFS